MRLSRLTLAGVSLLAALLVGLASAGIALADTDLSLPVTAVAPEAGQLAAPTSTIQIQLNVNAPRWRAIRAQFDNGMFGLRLAGDGTVVWFLPGDRGDLGALRRAGLTVSNAVAYDPRSGVVSASPDQLAPGQTYTATLAIEDDLAALLVADVGHRTPPPSSDHATSYTWSFLVASAKTNGNASGVAPTLPLGNNQAFSASGTGSGTISLASYAGAPVAPAPSFPPATSYLDVAVSLGNSFTAVTARQCGLGRPATASWWDGSAWQTVSAQAYSNGCLTLIFTASSSPTIAELTGTAFASVPAPPAVTAVTRATGQPGGGDAVAVDGSGLTGATGVSFGGAAVPSGGFSVVSDSRIEVWSTPAGSGTVDVTVSGPDGTSAAVPADQFRYAATDQTVQRVAVPSYFYPASGSPWAQLDGGGPAVGIAIINPASGPGSAPDPSYAAQVQASQQAGVAVLGYVHTSYGGRAAATVQAEIDDYYSWYHVDGIFFDEASTDCSLASSYYGPLSSHVKAQGGSALVVLNPGTATPECYLSVADVLVTFEGDAATYAAGYVAPAWAGKYPADRTWHLVYGASTESQLDSSVVLSKQHGAGWIYVTNDTLPNPWDTLPADPYWSDELLAAQSPPPTLTGLSPSSGPAAGGTVVTATGTGLDHASQVCFGAGDCVGPSGITVDPSGNSITAVSPSGLAGTTVDVTVTTPGGTTTAVAGGRFTFTAPPNLLANGDFSAGLGGWTIACNNWGSSGGGPLPCGSGAASTSPAGLTLDTSLAGAPYLSAVQVVPATASSVLRGTVTVNRLTECNADNSVMVTVTLLDAGQQPLGNPDVLLGNVAFAHHPYVTGCSPFVYGGSPVSFYQDMPNWSAGAGSQQFAIPIGSIVSQHLTGIDPSRVAYVQVRLLVYDDTAQPSATFGNLSLTNVVTENVKADGAVGDGVTDDTAAFQRALGQIDGAGGGILVVPPGSYVVQPSALTVHRSDVIDGIGATLLPATTGYEMLEIDGPNVVINGLTLEGSNLVVRGISIDGGSSNTIVTRVTVRDLRQSSVSTDVTYTGMPVGIKVYGNLDRLQIDTTSVGNVAADRPECSAASCTPVARGILISPGTNETGATNVVVEYSSFDGVGPKDDGDCIVAQDATNAANLTIYHNQFTYCAKRAVKIQVPGATVADNSITNPYLNDNFTATDPQSSFPYDMYAAISVYQSNVSVTDNTVSGTGGFYNGIEISSPCTAPLTNVAVTGNTVQMGTSAYVTGAALVRAMGPVNGLTITGNTLDHADSGVELATGTGATVANNMITDVQNALTYYSPTCSP